MPTKKSIDLKTRLRIAGHVRRYLARHPDVTQQQLEKQLGLGKGGVSKILGQGSLGLDVVIKLVRRLPIDAETLINSDPPSDSRTSE